MMKPTQITKASAVREIVAKCAGLLTNRQIQDHVLKAYGLHVESNQIVQTVGSFHSRLAQGGLPPHLILQAKAFLSACGGEYRHAKRVLEMAVNHV